MMTHRMKLGWSFIGTVLLSGIAVGGASIKMDSKFASNALRTLGTTQLSLAEEMAATALPEGYRVIPKISIDDDGFNRVGKVVRSSDGLEWSTGVSRKVCGSRQTSIAMRIADCNFQHGTKPSWADAGAESISWNGAERGNSGEGTWTLVTVFNYGLPDGTTCDNNCFEVWRDNRTGLLWSDSFGSFNWCRAAGASNREGSPYAESDPAFYCNVDYQQSQVNPVSACFEDANWLMTPTGTIDGVSFEYDAAKGGMRKNNTDHSPSVDWRLPTIEQWQVAILNGFDRVLRPAADLSWSASLVSQYKNEAWRLASRGRVIDKYLRTSTERVRCVGR